MFYVIVVLRNECLVFGVLYFYYGIVVFYLGGWGLCVFDLVILDKCLILVFWFSFFGGEWLCEIGNFEGLESGVFGFFFEDVDLWGCWGLGKRRFVLFLCIGLEISFEG